MKQLHQLGVKVPEQVSVVGLTILLLRRIWCRRSPASGCRVTEMIKESINRLIFMLMAGNSTFSKLPER